MTKSNQIPVDKLEIYARNSLKKKAERSRGPKTLTGKIKSLANLQKKTKKSDKLQEDKNKFDFDFNYVNINKEKSYSKNQKKHYKRRFRTILEAFHQPTELVLPLVHNAVLMEIDMKNICRDLTSSNINITKKTKLRRSLFQAIESYRKIFKVLNPNQYSRETSEILGIEEKEYATYDTPSALVCTKSYWHTYGHTPEESARRANKLREEEIKDCIASKERVWARHDERFEEALKKGDLLRMKEISRDDDDFWEQF